jgi:nucleotide-binding universal stress UspA family protein
VYEQIVVGTDGSEGANTAVDAAVKLAGLTGATLHVVQAYKVVDAATMVMGADAPMLTSGVPEANEAAREHAQQVCDNAVERAQRSGVRARAHVMPGKAADVLIQLAGYVEADLIVVGNRGMAGARRFVLGSVPNKVAHHCPTSVLVVDTSPARS